MVTDWFTTRVSKACGFAVVFTLVAILGVAVFGIKKDLDLRLTAPVDSDQTDLEVVTGRPGVPDRRTDGGSDADSDEVEQAEIVVAEKALFVDPQRGSGSNAGTVEAPFKRPIEAFSVVEPGTTIYFRGGTYDDRELGANLLRRSGTTDAWINIEPYPGEDVEIVAGGEWGNGFELNGSAFVKISGFVIRGREDSIHGSGVFGKDNSHDVLVAGNYIEGFGGAGISFVHSSRVTVERNEVRENAARSFYQGSGITLFEAMGPLADGEGFSNVVRANLVVGNYNGVPSRAGTLTDGNCIIIDFFNEVSYQGTTLVENNICVENGGRGIHVFNSSNVTARHNTMIGNNRSVALGGKAEMVAAKGTNIVFTNNLVLNTAGVASYVRSNADDAFFSNNYVLSEAPEGPGNVVLDRDDQILISRSGRVEIGAYRPVTQSPVVGTARSEFQPEVDALGFQRPSQGAVGALEPALANGVFE